MSLNSTVDKVMQYIMIHLVLLCTYKVVMCDISILYRYRDIFAHTVSYRNQYCICLCKINIELQKLIINDMSNYQA